MEGFFSRAAGAGRGLLGTWVKIPSFETVELLGHAGFDFVVIDMEHAPHPGDLVYRLVFAAQKMGMGALVRLPDRSETEVQRILDGGADGLLVPRVTSISEAREITRAMVFAPEGTRGLGSTSRAGRWGLKPVEDYLRHGNGQCVRMIQLEDWDSLQRAAEFAALPHVNGIFIGHGDLFLSSGRPASDPEVRALSAGVAQMARSAGILSGAAAGTPEEARIYLDMGFSLVMVSNDATLFGRAAAGAVAEARG
ncbi:HpcH/HpaI aldolase/citrate lyase family protein [Sphingomonas canadensis]|uniref:HpcH/HpaI aldolase/citrate lyase family protein n=1 Tax=Sphingomonas canadensis TaxID=1219257 RepID=A0ABW3H6B7_9SPHN|nr:aldolase/citrate lyase family protein [Sphingomonas canadensis]MCW3835628.1 aldolase/citrate lyase family protein [Sphingomonas canadensis]